MLNADTDLLFSKQLAVEAITNIRTVAGLRREKTFVERYIAELSGPHETAKRKAHVRGLVFGFAQAMPFFAYAGCMYYGGYLVSTEDLPYENVFK
jgi:ATP-binding cassette subfamily B (MDR/TAP) protein 1